MRVWSSPFMNLWSGHSASRLVVAAFSCAILSACIGNPFEDAKVDPRSPIAAEVTKSVRLGVNYPAFRDIPAVPKDVRPHMQYGEQAALTEKEAAALTLATVSDTWTLNNSEAFAAHARAAAGPEIPPADPLDTAAFAKAIKDRATLPPPPRR